MLHSKAKQRLGEEIDSGTADIDPRFTTDDDPDRTSSSFEIHGTLVDDRGTPLADEAIVVGLDPSSEMLLRADEFGSGAEGLALAGAVTQETGEFALQVPALKDIDQYLDEENTVTLLFISSGENHALVFRQEGVRLPSTPGMPATVSVLDERILPTETLDASQPTGLNPNPEPPPFDNITLQATSVVAGGEEPAAVDPLSECLRVLNRKDLFVAWEWRREGTSTTSYVPVQRIHTGARTKARFEWSNTKETRVTTAINFEYKAVKARGGYTKSVVSSAGVNFAAGNNQKVLFDVNYSFYRYRLWCRNAVESWKDSKVVEYRPYAFTGFNRNRAVTVGYGCKTAYNGSLSNELWVSRSNTTTIGGEFSLIGISLNAQQKHTDSHKKYYTPTRSGARICGENNYPALTEKVREGVY